MDKFFRPSLTDLTRHAFKVEAKRIADGTNNDGCGAVLPGDVRVDVPGDSVGNKQDDGSLKDLTLPPRVRIIKEWGEREK